MGTCYDHARSSAVLFGGKWEDYYDLHLWFDQSKAHIADFRHRAMLHHSAGIFMLEAAFGPTITNSDGKVIPTRLIGEQHVKEDCGFIPTVADWLQAINSADWMRKGYPIETLVEKTTTFQTTKTKTKL
jgi:hypothetical protein